MEFSETIDIDAAPDEAWEVIGDLASVSRWVPGVTAVDVDGMNRVCTFEDGHSQIERIVLWDAAARTLAYEVDGGLPVRDNRGSFRVVATEAGCRVEWSSSWEALDPNSADAIAAMWREALPAVLARLRATIERAPVAP